MAILKCKMCGGDLNITADEKIVECEFCGTTQTIPDGSDEKKTNLFNRANRLRIANEFDKAAGIYESIIAEFPDEAESYWGLCLCKFGIEYVDDPKTAKKIPTCHRTSFESIFDDENYKRALEKSDVIAQGVYKEEAAVIDNLQKDILSIVHKEEPFDVFICYKETDDLGGRTQDSVMAQDIYDALTDKGFKVFFSRITLEDKLGKQYEPYIFAALNSAKVMLAIGTKEEYYNAVWVKNEWSRYLALMESDKSKMLIPCYRDIDPYDMPQEFKNLQGQDMSKLGFLQDLVRGISKIVAPEQNRPANAEHAPTTSANATTDSLLKRAFMFLEDGNWKSAEEYCEKVLDINPECAEAYLGKLMVELHVRTQDELKKCKDSFSVDKNYQKIIRFADEKLKQEMEGYINHIKKENAYSNAIGFMKRGTLEGYATAIKCFESIPEWKDSADKIIECQKSIETLNDESYNKAIALLNKDRYFLAIQILKQIKSYMDSNELLEKAIIESESMMQLSSVKVNGKWGYINEKGNMVIVPQFDLVEDFSENGLACVEVNGKWGCINEKGNMVIEPQFDATWGFNENGLARVKVNGKWGYINEVGDMVIEPQFDYAYNFSQNGLAHVKVNGKWGCINEKGNMVIVSQFDLVEDFSENGLARVKVNDKWGYINEVGDMVIEPQFDATWGFNENGLSRVTVNGKWGYINEKGNVVIEPQFDLVEDFSENGLARVKVNGKWGYIDEKGNIEIELKFDGAGEFVVLLKQNIEKRNKREDRLRQEKQQEEARIAEKNRVEEEKKRLEQQRLEQQKQLQAQRRADGLCQHCGGKFKGLFTKTCTNCGKGKDY